MDAAAQQNRGIVESRWNSRINGEIAARNYRMLIESARQQRPGEQLQATVASEHV